MSVSKRRRTREANGLWAPFRALGLVCSPNVGLELQIRNAKGQLKPDVSIFAAVGRSWAQWTLEGLRLRFVGAEIEGDESSVTSLAIASDAVYAAKGHRILRYGRGKVVGSLETGSKRDRIGKTIIFGDCMVALHADGSKMWSWTLGAPQNAQQPSSTIVFADGFTAAHVLHPPTYVNKVIVASREGGLQLWNVNTRYVSCIHGPHVRSSLIHSFASVTASSSRTPAFTITSLAASPAIDVIAVGLSTGACILLDVRADLELFRVSHSATASPVVSASFRTDGQAHHLATAHENGSMLIWDLDAEDSDDEAMVASAPPGRIVHVLRNAHEEPITSLQWVPGQALLVSSGNDNAIKQWVFESEGAPPKLLRSRQGHVRPPALVRFYGEDGKSILSAGGSGAGDLRMTSVVRDSRSYELSQGPLQKRAKDLNLPISALRLPPVTALHYSTQRSFDWDDVLTTHAGQSIAHSWSVDNKRMGEHAFRLDRTNKGSAKSTAHGSAAPATAVCVSACGNFGFVGFEGGSVVGWNMQSGILRRSYDLSAAAKSVGDKSAAASKPTGIATDALNRFVIVATQSGHLHFFDFRTCALLYSLALPAGALSVLLQRDNGLLAVVCDDMAVRILDIETRRIVRELVAFRGRVLDIAFSPDSRWLVTSSLDSVVRTFDLPTGRLIDAFRTPSVATSISFSPTADFVATSHVDSVGVHLWANRALFADISLRVQVDEDFLPALSMPALHGEDEDEQTGEALADEGIAYADTDELTVESKQLAPNLISLSSQPKTKWSALLNLDAIRARNKPVEPPKAPERAPFFLPTISGVETRFDLSKTTTGGKDANGPALGEGSRLGLSTADVQSELVTLLDAEAQDGDYEIFFSRMFDLSAPALDYELRSLPLSHIATIFRALTARLRTHRDFEAIQAVVAVLLRVHADFLLQADMDEQDALDDDVIEAMEALQIEQERESNRLGRLVGSCLGSLNFVRGL